MLSRTAENLFWLARYMERAETMARLLEVGYRMALMPSAGEGYRNEWASLVAAAGSSAGFEAKFGETFRQRDVETWLFFDRENPSSVISCIETARQNGRAVRTALTTEMWDALNGAYLELREIERRPRSENPLPQLCDWTKRQGALFRGATEGTHLQNDGYDFLNLGYYLERGDNTARLLDVKYYVLLPTTDMVGGSIDTYQWTTLLRALSALPRLPLDLRRRVQPAQDRALPDPEPRLPAVAAALPRPGRLPPRPAGAAPTAGARRRTTGCTRSLGELAEAPGRGHHRGGAARVPHPLHPPERGARAATWPTATCSGSSDAPQRPPRHGLPVRRADALRHPEPPADAGVERRRSRCSTGRSRAEGALFGASFTDGAGDLVTTMTVQGPVERIEVVVEGTVETTDTAGVLRGHREVISPRVYLQPTAATKPNRALRELGARRARQGRRRAARPGAPAVGRRSRRRSPTSRAPPAPRPPRPRRSSSGGASARTWRTR